MRVAVIGGGLAGCATAIALRNVGAEVTVFEAASQPRREGQSVSLLMNGTAAFAALGVGPQPGHRITKLTSLQHRSGRRLSTIDAAALEARFGHPYVVVSRRELLDPLLGALDGSIVYAKRATTVENTPSGAGVHFADGTSEGADLVVVADGARSALRLSLWPADQGQFFSFAFQGTVDLHPDYPSADTAFLCMGPGVFTGTFPTTNGQVGWFIDQRAEVPARPPAPVKNYLLSRFRDWSGPLRALIEATPEEEVDAEVYPIYVRRPRWGKGRVVLAGDAAHSLNPALGQGTNQAFTDAVALGAAVSTSRAADEVLATYSRSRSRRATMFWRMAKMTLHPALARFSDLARWNSDGMATRSWRLLTRPDPVVRAALASEGRSAK